MARIWFGNERGRKEYEPAALDSETQGQAQAVLRRLHALALATVRYRALTQGAAASREAVVERAALERTLSRQAAGDQDLAQALADLADRLAPRPADPALSYAGVWAALSPPVAPPAPAAVAARPDAPGVSGRSTPPGG